MGIILIIEEHINSFRTYITHKINTTSSAFIK